jgi:hypothetical protein
LIIERFLFDLGYAGYAIEVLSCSFNDGREGIIGGNFITAPRVGTARRDEIE